MQFKVGDVVEYIGWTRLKFTRFKTYKVLDTSSFTYGPNFPLLNEVCAEDDNGLQVWMAETDFATHKPQAAANPVATKSLQPSIPVNTFQLDKNLSLVDFKIEKVTCSHIETKLVDWGLPQVKPYKVCSECKIEL